MIRLFYYPGNASFAPHCLLKHVNAEYQLELVDRLGGQHKTQEYLSLNPAGRIPVLVIDDQPIFESAAICIHIAELFPSYELIPPIGDPLRPIFFQWLSYLNNTLQSELMIRHYPHYHTDQPSTISGIITAQDQRIAHVLSLIDKQLEGKTFVLGEQLSVCDFFLFMLAQWSLIAQPSPFEFKNLATFLNHFSQHPTIEFVCQVESIDLRPFRSPV